jgi:hypothetical protein
MRLPPFSQDRRVGTGAAVVGIGLGRGHDGPVSLRDLPEEGPSSTGQVVLKESSSTLSLTTELE